MKKSKINNRYINHNICSIVGTKTIITSIDTYIDDAILKLKEIHTECDREDFNADTLLFPTIQICDMSYELLHHKLDLLKSSLNRYLFADEDFPTSELKHDKILHSTRQLPKKQFKSRISEHYTPLPQLNLDDTRGDIVEDFYDECH